MFNPFGNGTGPAPAYNWQSEPNDRGTWSIISSCLITLILCLWTALHLNIPATEGDTHQWQRKTRWLLVGLLAPEMIVFLALNQRRVARRLTRKMRSVFKEAPEPCFRSKLPFVGHRLAASRSPESDSENNAKNGSQSLRRHSWTQVHSFYAISGGFAFDTRAANPNFLPGGRTRVTLRPHGLRYIAEHAPELIPDMSAEDIKDKSKVDGLGKFLVCVQAIWFCTQTIFRLAQNYPISFMELNTFAHSLCALLVYFLWWNKPLDISVPTLMSGEQAWELCALMCVKSSRLQLTYVFLVQFFYRSTHIVGMENDHEDTELGGGFKFGDEALEGWQEFFRGECRSKVRRYFLQPRPIFRWDPDPASLNEEIAANGTNYDQICIKKGQRLFGFRCTDVVSSVDVFKALMNDSSQYGYRSKSCLKMAKRLESEFIETYGNIEATGLQAHLIPADIRRWGLTSKAWCKYGGERERYRKEKAMKKGDAIYDSVCYRINNMMDLETTPSTMIDNKGDDAYVVVMMVLIFTLAGGIYGSLHLLAWHSAFASRAEQIMWRLSGLCVAGAGPVSIAMLPPIIIYAFIANMLSSPDKLGNYLPTITKNIIFGLLVGIHMILVLIFFVAMISLMFGYLLARIYLVVESCIQLARLPSGAYKNPEWSNIFPHVG